MHHATLGTDDFLEPKRLNSGKDFVIASFTDEFPDVDVKVKMEHCGNHMWWKFVRTRITLPPIIAGTPGMAWTS